MCDLGAGGCGGGKEIKAGTGKANKACPRLAQEGWATQMLPPLPSSSRWVSLPYFFEVSLPWTYIRNTEILAF